MIAFPGDFGPMDQRLEALTLIQTVKIAPIPIVLFGEELWRDIINCKGMAKAGAISEQDFDLVIYVETTEVAWNAIRNQTARQYRPWSRRNLQVALLRFSGGGSDFVTSNSQALWLLTQAAMAAAESSGQVRPIPEI